MYLWPRATDLVAKKGDRRLFCRGNDQLDGGGHQVSQHLPLRPMASHLNRVLRYCDVGEYILDCTKDLFENSYGILALLAMSSLSSWDDHPMQENDDPANAGIVLLHRARGPGYLHCSSFLVNFMGTSLMPYSVLPPWNFVLCCLFADLCIHFLSVMARTVVKSGWSP